MELLDTEADNKNHGKKSKKQINKSNIGKNVSFLDEIFDYFYMAKSRHFFLLAKDDNTTFVSNAQTSTIPKTLSVLYCN